MSIVKPAKILGASGSGGDVTVDHITDATDTGKALLKASDGEAAMKALENADGDITVGKGMIFKADTITDEHIIEFHYAPHDGKADASIMANANAQGGAIALAVRGESDPVPVNAVTLTAAGIKQIIIGHPDFTLHVGKAMVDISNITAFAKSVVECATAEALRELIGAGTSNLAIGTTATTAKAGNWTPASADLPAATATAVNAAGYNLFSPFYFDCRYLSTVMSGFHRFIITYWRWPFGQYTGFTFFLQAVAFPLNIQRG